MGREVVDGDDLLTLYSSGSFRPFWVSFFRLCIDLYGLLTVFRRWAELFRRVRKKESTRREKSTSSRSEYKRRLSSPALDPLTSWTVSVLLRNR